MLQQAGERLSVRIPRCVSKAYAPVCCKDEEDDSIVAAVQHAPATSDEACSSTTVACTGDRNQFHHLPTANTVLVPGFEADQTIYLVSMLIDQRGHRRSRQSYRYIKSAIRR